MVQTDVAALLCFRANHPRDPRAPQSASRRPATQALLLDRRDHVLDHLLGVAVGITV